MLQVEDGTRYTPQDDDGNSQSEPLQQHVQKWKGKAMIHRVLEGMILGYGIDRETEKDNDPQWGRLGEAKQC